MTLTVALVTIDYPPDPVASGIGAYTCALAHALAERGHKVIVLSRGEEGVSLEQEGRVHVYRLGPPRFALPLQVTLGVVLKLASSILRDEWRYRRRLAGTLSRLVKEEGVTLIEAADSAAEALFYPVQAHPQVPFIVRLHGPTAIHELFDHNIPEGVRRLIGSIERRLFLKATHLSTPSRDARDFIAKAMGLSGTITVLPNVPTFEPPQAATAAEEEANTILFVGRLTEGKGVHVLMEALPRVLERCPEARFLMVGPNAPTGRDYPTTQAYLESLLTPSQRQQVTFTGLVPHADLAAYYRRAAVCVFPSLFETFSYTCLEAMSFGKAIVGSRRSGMRDLLAEDAGLLYTAPDAAELAAHIVTLLENPDLRKGYGERARARFEEHYSKDRVMAQVEAYYEQAIREVRAEGATGDPNG